MSVDRALPPLLLWVVRATSPQLMARLEPPIETGSRGHDEVGAHWLVPSPTAEHGARFSHRLVVFNDGVRLHAALAPAEHGWHPPLLPGVFYCLDTRIVYEELDDERFPDPPGERRRQLVIAVERERPLAAPAAWRLVGPFLERALGARIAPTRRSPPH